MNPVLDFFHMLRNYGPPEPRFYHRTALYLLKLSAFEPLRWLEQARERTPASERILAHPPVFVLGYYRSGTTHLQEVLLTDPQFTYINFYQGFFPAAFRITEGWLQPVFERIMTGIGFLHPAHQIPFSFWLPCEEDVSLVASGSRLAANWGQVLPRYFETIYRRMGLLEGITPAERTGLKAELHDLYWRVSKSGGDRRLLLKSPPQTGRLALLLEMYPAAKFIFIHRDPVDVYGSNLKLWRSFEEQHMQSIGPEQVHEHILWTHDACHRNYTRDKAACAPGQLCEVGFEAFIADPLATLREIYATLELGDFDRVEPGFETYLADHHKPEPEQYQLDPAVEADVRARLAPWIEAWGQAPPHGL